MWVRIPGPRYCGLVAIPCPPPAAHEKAYPAKPVELVVPFPAGGAADVIARMVAQVVSEKWGQSVVIENKAGATGAIGGEYVVRAAPDGYTLLEATASTHAVLPAYRSDLEIRHRHKLRSGNAACDLSEPPGRQSENRAGKDRGRVHRIAQKPARQAHLRQFRPGQRSILPASCSS